MIEHVLAALAGMRVDNCVVQDRRAECPGCDGSSRAFVEVLEQAGIVEQDRMRRSSCSKARWSSARGTPCWRPIPAPRGALTLAYHLDYGPDAPIRAQSYCVGMSPETFKRELASSRTFLTESRGDRSARSGIGLRTTPADLLIFGREGVIGNSLRFPDECARHKVLDMVGDLALLGFDLEGFVVAHRSGPPDQPRPGSPAARARRPATAAQHRGRRACEARTELSTFRAS